MDQSEGKAGRLYDYLSIAAAAADENARAGSKANDGHIATERLFTTLYYLARLESAFYQSALAGSGRLVTEHYVLSLLRQFGPQRPVELNAILQQTSAGMTNTLTRLEKLGFVKRVRGKDDNRAVEIHLTAKGRKEADALRARVAEAANEKSAALSDAEKLSLAKALDKLIGVLSS